MDPNVVAAGVFTLFGVALGFGLTEVKAFFERKRRKKAVAALLFIELKQLMIFIDAELALPKHGVQEMFEPLRTPAFDAHSGELVSLFDSSLVDGIVVFYGRLSAFNGQGEELRRAISELRSLERQKHSHDEMAMGFTIGSAESAESQAHDRFFDAQLKSARGEVMELGAVSKSFARQVRETARDVELHLKELSPKHAGEQIERLKVIVSGKSTGPQ